MHQLRYADEVRSIAEVPMGEAEIKGGELKLALQIVEQAVSEEFRPEAYEDGVRKRVVQAIEQKIQGLEITEEPTEEPKAQVIDLMEALKASLAQKLGERKPARRSELAVGEAKSRPGSKAAKRSRS